MLSGDAFLGRPRKGNALISAGTAAVVMKRSRWRLRVAAASVEQR